MDLWKAGNLSQSLRVPGFAVRDAEVPFTLEANDGGGGAETAVHRRQWLPFHIYSDCSKNFLRSGAQQLSVELVKLDRRESSEHGECHCDAPTVVSMPSANPLATMPMNISRRMRRSRVPREYVP